MECSACQNLYHQVKFRILTFLFGYGSVSVIRILGSVHALDTDPDPDPAHFLSSFHGGINKFFFLVFLLIYYFIFYSLKDNTSLNSQKIIEFKVFLDIFAC
jgi:hypothetical protein